MRAGPPPGRPAQDARESPGPTPETTTYRTLISYLTQQFNAHRATTWRGLAVAVIALTITTLPAGNVDPALASSATQLDAASSAAVRGLLAAPPAAAARGSFRLPAAPRADRADRPVTTAVKAKTKTTTKTTTTVKTTVPPPAARSVEAVVGFALAQVGKPYQWGAAGPGAYDCSGLVMAAFARAGVRLPHQSEQIAAYGRVVSRAQLQRGDVILYSGHVAIALGGGMMVHAANPRTGIVVAKIYGSPVGYRRML